MKTKLASKALTSREQAARATGTYGNVRLLESQKRESNDDGPVAARILSLQLTGAPP